MACFAVHYRPHELELGWSYLAETYAVAFDELLVSCSFFVGIVFD